MVLCKYRMDSKMHAMKLVGRDEFYARLNIFMRHHVLDRLLFVCSQSGCLLSETDD